MLEVGTLCLHQPIFEKTESPWPLGTLLVIERLYSQMNMTFGRPYHSDKCTWVWCADLVEADALTILAAQAE